MPQEDSLQKQTTAQGNTDQRSLKEELDSFWAHFADKLGMDIDEINKARERDIYRRPMPLQDNDEVILGAGSGEGPVKLIDPQTGRELSKEERARLEERSRQRQEEQKRRQAQSNRQERS